MTDEQKDWMLRGGRLAYMFLIAFLMTDEQREQAINLVEMLNEKKCQEKSEV